MVVRNLGGPRRRGPNPDDEWSPRYVPVASGGLDSTIVTTDLNRRVASLLSAALRADDAEASGFDARTLISDPVQAVALLGSPEVSPVARHGVVQRFGGVGALLVLACEDRWRLLHLGRSTGEGASTGRDGTTPEEAAVSADRERAEDVDRLHSDLRRLLELFTYLGADEMAQLVRAIENAACDSAEGAHDEDPQADAEARRWLHVTYAVAARDGTEEAHRAYVGALDRVLALKRELSLA